MVDEQKLRQLAEAAKAWTPNHATQTKEQASDGEACVGSIDGDDVFYPIVTVDTGLYFQPKDAINLANFYAAANPAAILALLDRVKELELDVAHKDAYAEQMGRELSKADTELRRLADIEHEHRALLVNEQNLREELAALKASLGEPVAWHSPEETDSAQGLVWLRENGVVFLGYHFEQPFKEYRDTDGFYVGQQDAESYWARHEDAEPCDPDGWCQLLPPLYALTNKDQS